MKNIFSRSTARVLSVLALFVIVSGCYMPVRFDMEVEMQRTGHYTAIFDGYIADLGIYGDLKKNKLTPEQEKEKVARIFTDLQRTSDITNVKYMQNGIFQVNWQHKGDIIKERMHTFIRRNEAFLTFKYTEKEGRIVITGRKLKNKQVDQLAKIGLGTVEGELRIKTAATVSDHNAHTVKKRKSGGYIYTWKIRSFKEKTPRLVIPVR